ASPSMHQLINIFSTSSISANPAKLTPASPFSIRTHQSSSALPWWTTFVRTLFWSPRIPPGGVYCTPSQFLQLHPILVFHPNTWVEYLRSPLGRIFLSQ